MVLIVDLDSDSDSPDPLSTNNIKPHHHQHQHQHHNGRTNGRDPHPPAQHDLDRPNPNFNNGFSAALSCYPVVRQLAGQLDLNTLDSLSRTCRQFRANLLESRGQLVGRTLRCEWEGYGEGEEGGFGVGNGPREEGGRLTSGKVGRCARDMVGECQRCARVVCRNCTIKPPARPALNARHRRLCRTCTKAPLTLLTAPHRESPASHNSDHSHSPPPTTPDLHSTDFPAPETPRAFTAPAFERSPCSCESLVWLCQPCGQHLKKSDTLYIRAWSWRTRYSHYLGGVGTGAGEGNEGVECGRGAACLAAKTVEHEIECDAQTVAELEGGEARERWTGSSYRAQEIEGVGGGFKMKAKRFVRVGECVKVFEDERGRAMAFLGREVRGELRSWCAWCERVVPGERDLRGEGERNSSSSSSVGSEG